MFCVHRVELLEFLEISHMNVRTKAYLNHEVFVGITIIGIPIDHFYWTRGERYVLFQQAHELYVNEDLPNKIL